MDTLAGLLEILEKALFAAIWFAWVWAICGGLRGLFTSAYLNELTRLSTGYPPRRWPLRARLGAVLATGGLSTRAKFRNLRGELATERLMQRIDAQNRVGSGPTQDKVSRWSGIFKAIVSAPFDSEHVTSIRMARARGLTRTTEAEAVDTVNALDRLFQRLGPPPPHLRNSSVTPVSGGDGGEAE